MQDLDDQQADRPAGDLGGDASMIVHTMTIVNGRCDDGTNKSLDRERLASLRSTLEPSTSHSR